MSKKVKVAIFDRDLKARQFGNFEVSKDGAKINVRKGGKRNFNPTFDNDSFIDFPRKLGPLILGWKRVYFARNGAKSCVRFRSEGTKNDFLEPDPQQVIEAAKSEMIKNFGAKKIETSWQMWLIIVMNVLIFLKVMGVLV